MNPSLQYCTRADIFELTPIDEKIDFNIIGRDGGNIFKKCFAPLLRKQPETSGRNNPHSRNITHEEWKEFIQGYQNKLNEHSFHLPAIEDRFFKLVKAGEKYKYDTDAIIEIPDDIGSTVFETASLFSVKICNYILDRNIRVNNILVNFVYPAFPIPDIATFNDDIRKLFESNHRKLISIDIVYALFNETMLEKMLQKGINPKIISGRDFIFES